MKPLVLEGFFSSHKGGTVLRTLHRVHQIHYGRTFVAMIFVSEEAAWVHQAHDTELLDLFYMIIGLTHYEKQTSCT